MSLSIPKMPMSNLQRVRLPDGLEIWSLNPLEAEVLYREIVAERTYEQHGITLSAGDVVFDAGANIGLFSVHLARTVPGVRVHAFEPIPVVFDALRRNLTEYAPSAALHNVALGAAAGEATFTLDPAMTLATTMNPAEVASAVRRGRSVTTWARAGLADFQRVRTSGVASAVERALQHPLTRPFAVAGVVAYAIALDVRKRIRATTHVCPITTVSAALAAAGVDRIDLLKIDVEGAEEDVVRGIGESDWARIRQLVIEVHDVNGRPARLRALLESHGYRTVAAREDWALHELLGISTLYAYRA